MFINVSREDFISALELGVKVSVKRLKGVDSIEDIDVDGESNLDLINLQENSDGLNGDIGEDSFEVNKEFTLEEDNDVNVFEDEAVEYDGDSDEEDGYSYDLDDFDVDEDDSIEDDSLDTEFEDDEEFEEDEIDEFSFASLDEDEEIEYEEEVDEDDEFGYVGLDEDEEFEEDIDEGCSVGDVDFEVDVDNEVESEFENDVQQNVVFDLSVENVIAENIVDRMGTSSDSSKNLGQSDVVYHSGMSLYEFLRKNPSIRKEEDVLKYYSLSTIREYVKKGKVLYKKGKLII